MRDSAATFIGTAPRYPHTAFAPGLLSLVVVGGLALRIASAVRRIGSNGSASHLASHSQDRLTIFLRSGVLDRTPLVPL
jgi:hypothetical protein